MIGQYLDVMEEHFTNHFYKYFFSFLICVIALIVYAANEGKKKNDIENENKLIWFNKHGCVHHGYVGSNHPIKLYKCGEQLLIWRDIPTE